MAVLGVTGAVAFLALTGSWWWALAGLLGSGVVANAVTSARSAPRTNARRTTR